VSGRQPNLDIMAKVGYLYRTTAVYGSGKFGMADWNKVKCSYPDFASPFAAEMFSCYLIRHFSLQQVDWVAKHRSPETAVETALARILTYRKPNADKCGDFECYVLKAMQHLDEIATDNVAQNAINTNARSEIEKCLFWVKENQNIITEWPVFETQELLNAILTEIYPEDIYDLEDSLNVTETYEMIPHMKLSQLKLQIETHYDWALSMNPAQKKK